MPVHFQPKLNSSYSSSASIPLLEQHQKKKEIDQDQLTVKKLAPVIGTIALGILFSPSFAIGCAVGVVTLVIRSYCAVCFISNKEKGESDYTKTLKSLTPFAIAIKLPIIEEFLRGGIQAGAIGIGKIALPLITGLPLMAAQLTRVHAFSIILAGSLFGAAHLTNKHENRKQQAILATISGIVGGILQLKYGLIAAIGRHIINNTLATIALVVAIDNKKAMEKAAKDLENRSLYRPVDRAYTPLAAGA